jgi:hypothetical protein
LAFKAVHGGTEGWRKVARVSDGKELSMSGSAEHDFDATGWPVADKSYNGIGDMVQSCRNAADGRFGLGAK